jgi:hypothetical protein
MERQGAYRISVFMSPDPLRAGPIDISVLLQDAETGMPITNPQVNVSLTPSSGRGRTIHAVATNDAATNKLLSAALVELPEPGLWDIEIAYLAQHSSARVQFRADAGPRSAGWLNEWPWFSWPAAVVIIFVIHRGLVSRNKIALERSEALPALKFSSFKLVRDHSDSSGNGLSDLSKEFREARPDKTART